MKHKFLFLSLVLVAALFLGACSFEVGGYKVTLFESEPVAATETAAPAPTARPALPTATPSPEAGFTTDMIEKNDLVNPDLHHAGDNPAGNPASTFDIGVNDGQWGLVFGYEISWPDQNLTAGGNGCDMVVLPPGWYENIEITDGRYEVYTIPSSDYNGWVEVLVEQRIAEQADHYNCSSTGYHVFVWLEDGSSTRWTRFK